ncbi:MAG: hypothetical protein B7Z37_02460 [Verrucomicrobia bacterium 12-59-8]|nr:MAG: hypothetical protein B7Z37_02460 [Verrucomicrobia bacterium 12-59-8]
MTLLQLLAVYLLSHGPVMALYSSQRIHGSVPNAVTAFYQPLHWLYEQTPLGRPMTAYDAWWKHLLQQS